ncbi:competence protein ComEC [Spiroplasma sp. TIUS-1]|uniref:ComEC/Rec2 family competence protein n=1 Tax=Spiroplasma sp. TIUS-1 TaxID=216963 RepID=UPI0013989713|nr:MBL fold metallo-hydrolase [Spiroplasma sp. TIUS-1]QHX36193.1 competence protein ComEC [Spiroplasma sp. TIUS-1]
MHKLIIKILFIVFLPFYLLIVITSGSILKIQHKDNVAFVTLSVGNGLFSYLKIDDSAILFDCGIGGNPINWSNTFQGNSNFPTNYMKEDGIKIIENIFISHNHVDHYSNLKTIAKNFKIKNISVPYNFDKMNNQIKSYISETGANIISFKNTYKFKNITFKNLTYEWVTKNFKINKNENNNSMILDFELLNNRFLLTGDTENEPTKNLNMKFTNYDYFQVPHHGSDNSGTFNLLKKIKPKKCIISGTNNVKSWSKYSGGHNFPTENILSKIQNSCQDTYVTGYAKNYSGEHSLEYFPRIHEIFKTSKTIQSY